MPRGMVQGHEVGAGGGSGAHGRRLRRQPPPCRVAEEQGHPPSASDDCSVPACADARPHTTTTSSEGAPCVVGHRLSSAGTRPVEFKYI